MKEKDIQRILEDVKNGNINVENAMGKLKDLPFEDLGYAKIDHHRGIRNGYPEVIYCEGKAIEHIQGIVEKMLLRNNNILATRADRKVYEAIKEVCDDVKYYEIARIVVVKKQEPEKTKNKILVATGGTSDMAVAEEAAITAEMLGNTVERLYDVGVAGIHRLLSHKSKLDEASVIIVAAGMEGALASVVGGLVDKPVIAVPTSVGYGANFGGLAALLAMLNSCASGVGVVNIDNGFGAGYLASTINRQIEKASL
ncbi:nickel pincer cofactor biosynthesis protein LarB [Sporosalibacterium faouarense]|uniref:nickel pincer cofactor biosynthesis protein LarB n=1 Tax=Sporosalibacterium faouarense TaxID=516123 RepID=UPI00141CFE5F|nr:nickel pincer cofactor biosynthesis protein LarB [Sporosalibacterium faouarense]MTI46743.1 nickel pincer cofactor biosynthesis protein LarB [Bacillota bacterium]